MLRLVRVVAGILFAVVALGSVAWAHVYIAREVFFEPRWGTGVASAGSLAVAALFASMLVVFWAERRLARPAVFWTALPGSVWMGFAFLLLMLLWGSEIALWFLPDTPEVSRGRALSCVALASGLTAWSMRNALGPPAVRRVEVAVRNWPPEHEGFRIAQISDLHIGPLLGPGFARTVTRGVLDLEPDLIAITGDLVDGDAARIGDDIAPFGELSAPHGVFFVTGNHDHLSRVDPWHERVSRLGIRVLRNECVAVGSPEAGFDLLGVDDARSHWIGGGSEDVERACARRRPGRPALLLAHDPSTWKRARRQGIDLQLSGHTHDGQIWPFRAVVRLVIPWVAGLHREGSSQLYVSRGTGFWGPPMRLGAPAEITQITLRAARD